MEGADPVEIELISHEERPARRGRRRRGEVAERLSTHAGTPVEPGEQPPWIPGVDGGPGSPGGSDPSTTERNRLVATAAVVGVLALLLGWMLGRSGGSGDPDELVVDDDVTTTVDELPISGDSVAAPDFEAGDGPDDTAEPSTTRPQSTVRTEAVEPEGLTTEQVAIDPRLAGLPVRLVGVEVGGSLVEVDLATGTLTDYHVGRISTDGPGIVVGSDWVVLGGMSDIARVISRDGTESRLDIGYFWNPLHVPGSDTIWSVRTDGPIEGYSVELVGIDGEPVGPAMELPADAWPLGADPRTGGLIVGNGAHVYLVTDAAIEHLGTGTVHAIGADSIVIYDCDEQMTCGLFHLDRATSERSVLGIEPEAGIEDRFRAVSFGGIGTISPDGRWATVAGTWGYGRPVVAIVELDSGRLIEVGGEISGRPPSVVWSPDSRYVFTIDNLKVSVYDPVADESFPVFTDSVRWSQIGIRPTAVGDGLPADEAVEP